MDNNVNYYKYRIQLLQTISSSSSEKEIDDAFAKIEKDFSKAISKGQFSRQTFVDRIPSLVKAYESKVNELLESDFKLTPLEEGIDDESDGSQIIALEDPEIYEDSDEPSPLVTAPVQESQAISAEEQTQESPEEKADNMTEKDHTKPRATVGNRVLSWFSSDQFLYPFVVAVVLALLFGAWTIGSGFFNKLQKNSDSVEQVADDLGHVEETIRIELGHNAESTKRNLETQSSEIDLKFQHQADKIVDESEKLSVKMDQIKSELAGNDSTTKEVLSRTEVGVSDVSSKMELEFSQLDTRVDNIAESLASVTPEIDHIRTEISEIKSEIKFIKDEVIKFLKQQR